MRLLPSLRLIKNLILPWVLHTTVLFVLHLNIYSLYHNIILEIKNVIFVDPK